MTFADAHGFLAKRIADMWEAMGRGFIRGMYFVKGDIVKDQFSGRPGLNRVSGIASNSWYVRHQTIGSDLVAVLSNAPRAWYIIIHQQGGNYHVTRKTRKGRKVSYTMHMPKRLWVPEYFASREATATITQAIRDAVRTEGSRR